MEQLNYVHLRGMVGRVSYSDVAGSKIVRMTVATNFCYKDRFGGAVIETTWHTVCGFASEGISMDIEKGDIVDVEGRIHQIQYTNSNGEPKSDIEIRAKSISKIEIGETPVMETD